MAVPSKVERAHALGPSNSAPRFVPQRNSERVPQDMGWH